MCFNDDDYSSYETRVEIRNGQRYYTEDYYPRFGMARRRRYGLGGAYYPSRYYSRPPTGRYTNSSFAYPNRDSQYRSGYPRGVVAGGYSRGVVPSGYSQAVVPRGFVGGGYPGYSSGYAYGTGYHVGANSVMPVNSAMRLRRSNKQQASALAMQAYSMEAYSKPRHQYIYNPRYGQRGILSYAGQAANGAAYSGVQGYGVGYAGVGVGVGVGYAAGAYQPAVYNTRPFYPQAYAVNYYAPSYSYPSYGGGYGYYNYNLYGSLYPLANFYYPYQRTYYNTVPNYGYTAHVYPPGQTTTTTTYHVTNSQAQAYSAPAAHVVRETRPAYAHGHVPHGPTREDIQLENRRIATERGAYDPRKIRPADARDDDPFWCREINGEWHLRSYYQIENECHPGRWMMDAEIGFLVFHRA